MGRPKKDPADLKGKQINIRTTERELKALKAAAKAANMSVSRYIIRAALEAARRGWGISE